MWRLTGFLILTFMMSCGSGGEKKTFEEFAFAPGGEFTDFQGTYVVNFTPDLASIQVYHCVSSSDQMTFSISGLTVSSTIDSLPIQGAYDKTTGKTSLNGQMVDVDGNEITFSMDGTFGYREKRNNTYSVSGDNYNLISSELISKAPATRGTAILLIKNSGGLTTQNCDFEFEGNIQ